MIRETEIVDETEWKWAVGIYKTDEIHDFHDDTPPPLVGRKLEFSSSDVTMVPTALPDNCAVFSARSTAQIVADFLNAMVLNAMPNRAIEPPRKFRPVKIRERVTRKLVCKHVL